MKVVVAGGSGFLGRPLVRALAAAHHEVVVLTRQPGAEGSGGKVREVAWIPEARVEPVDQGALAAGVRPHGWARELDGADAVVNLAGAGIADRRWTMRRKALLRTSRVQATRHLAAAVRAADRRPAVFIQGSAVGFYGAVADDRVFDESFPPGDDFLGQVCMAWEAEAHAVEALGVRLALVRTGIVLARDGGALKKMIPPFTFFVGGPIGAGHQYLSWIHRDDWIALVVWAISTAAVSGSVNATAPHPVTNAEFSRALGRALGRPSWLPVPGVALRLALGEMARDALILGQRVVPKRPIALGFQFKYERIDEAMAAAVGR